MAKDFDSNDIFVPITESHEYVGIMIIENEMNNILVLLLDWSMSLIAEIYLYILSISIGNL